MGWPVVKCSVLEESIGQSLSADTALWRHVQESLHCVNQVVHLQSWSRSSKVSHANMLLHLSFFFLYLLIYLFSKTLCHCSIKSSNSLKLGSVWYLLPHCIISLLLLGCPLACAAWLLHQLKCLIIASRKHHDFCWTLQILRCLKGIVYIIVCSKKEKTWH